MTTYKLYQKIKNAYGHYEYIDLNTSWSVSSIRGSARRLKAKNPALELSILKIEETEISIEGEDE